MRQHRSTVLSICALSLLLLAAGCADEPAEVTPTPAPEPTATPSPWADVTPGAAVYFGELAPVNASLAAAEADGWVMLVREGDNLRIEVESEGLPPDMMHLMHLHGFPQGGEATCAAADADANGDGVVDLIETEPASGTTLIPFHDDPVSLAIQSDAYPTAGADGGFAYSYSLSWDELAAAVSEQHGLATFDPAQLVVYVHGVPEDVQLPDTAQSLPDVPARVTVPIACAALEQVQ